MIVDGFPFCVQLLSPPTPDVTSLSNILSGFGGAAFGGLIAAISSFLAVKEQARITRQIDAERLENEVEGVIQSIYDEIETIHGGYVQSIGKHIEKLEHGKPFPHSYHVGEDYFTIYKSNAALIGKIQDKQLRSLIVNTYTKGKMLLDSFRFNNEIISRREQNLELYHREKDEYYRILANHEQGRLVLIASEIRERHASATESVSKLLRYIDQRKPKAD